MHRLSIFVILVLVTGCAFRSNNVHDTTESFYNLYSRNFVVAAPTAVANGVCGGVSGLALGVYTGHEAGFYVGALVGAHACGAVVGLPFIPLSYLCEENPWTMSDGHFGTTWTCNGAEKSSSKLQGHS
jgi:hypothetical protein